MFAMLFSLLTVLAAAPAIDGAARVQPTPDVQPMPAGQAKSCPNARLRHVVKPGQRLRPQRLDELPPAALELTVLREIDGCAIPAIVREGLGR